MRSSSSSSHPASSARINIAASAQRLAVDNRISLRYYYRIADNILKQADIFREEKNMIDLYVMLLRFSSLVSETIPCHREYKASMQSKKVYLKKKLLNTLTELEELKPLVQQKINELNRRQMTQVNGWGYNHQNDMLEWPSVEKKSYTSYDVAEAMKPAATEPLYQSLQALQVSKTKLIKEQVQRISLSFPRPKDDTLSRHSILGPNGLYGQWQPPKNDIQVQYPSNIDMTPVEIPRLPQSAECGLNARAESCSSEPGSLQQSIKNEMMEKSEIRNSESETLISNLVHAVRDDNEMCHAEEQSMISFETEIPVQPNIIRQPSPPAVLAEVHDLVPAMPTQVTEAEPKMNISSADDVVHSEPLQLHISTMMMENFMKLAKSNTDKDLETCGILAGSLKNRKFYVTALIIPKQESTANTCHTTNEEEIFEVQDKRSLFPLGWIHTHPTQSCFMSSVDVHTHYSYQIMLPEAVAIVMAPQDTSRKHGIFRLTTPGGMSVIRQCQQRGFHHHDPPEDGGPIYKTCTDVYMDSKLKFDVIDLR